MAPKSQNPKAPARGTARDRSPFVRPHINPQEESLEVELPKPKANSNYNNTMDPIALTT